MMLDLPREVYALVNGGPPGTSLLASRGLHYGDGVFRTLLRWEGRWLDVDRHYVKLVQDCRQIDLDPPHLGQMQSELDSLGGPRMQAVIGKIMLVRAGMSRGYAPSTRQADRILLRYPAPKFAAGNYHTGIAAISAAQPLSDQPQLAGAKHLNRLENVLASRGWPKGVDEALMCDTRGHVVCGSRSNLFWVKAGTLYTPKLQHCGVAGVMRAKVLELARSLQIPAVQFEAPVAVVMAADEAFICNAVIGLWPLRKINDAELPAQRLVTPRLQEALQHPMLIDGQAELPL